MEGEGRGGGALHRKEVGGKINSVPPLWDKITLSKEKKTQATGFLCEGLDPCNCQKEVKTADSERETE